MKRKLVSGITLAILLIGMLTLAFNIQSIITGETIYIRADGSVDPTDAPISTLDNVTYTFASIIFFNPIVIERDNIVVDGAGYPVYGIKTEIGIDLSGRSNVTIKNMEIENFKTGIRLDHSLNNTISGNKITNNWLYGVFLFSSSNNVLSGNNITNEHFAGIWLKYSSNNTLTENNIINNDNGIWLIDSSNNTLTENNIINNDDGFFLIDSPNNTLRSNNMSNNRVNFGVSGLNLSTFVNDVDASNTVDGKPIHYWINKQGMIVPLDTGYVALVNCTRIMIQNLNLTNNSEGVLLAFTTNSTITKNRIVDNDCGIDLFYSSNNRITGNNVTNNDRGISVRLSSNNTFFVNRIANNWNGIRLWDSSSNSIYGNNITANNMYGIWLEDSLNNSITKNNVINNEWRGIWLEHSSDNSIYHNNFIDNTRQVYDESWKDPSISPSINTWDDSYSSGGNYWSDYNGTDLTSGSSQNETGSDGIGDTPYFIDKDNQDNYPLMNPWTPSPPIPPPPPTIATVDVNPDTLNLKSKGRWITAHIELPEGYNVSNIDRSTILLNDTIPVDSFWLDKPLESVIGDYDNDGITDLMVKFDRQTLTEYLKTKRTTDAEVTLAITGEANGKPFEVTDSIKVIGQ